MSTHLVLKNRVDDLIAGRTMDFSLGLEPSFLFYPRYYLMRFNNGQIVEEHFSFMGMGKKMDKYLLVDGLNEKGLACAAFYLDGDIKYNIDEMRHRINLDPEEFIHWVLAKYSSVKELDQDLDRFNLVANDLYYIDRPMALYWVVTDGVDDSIVIEARDKKLCSYRNGLGMITNNPYFMEYFRGMEKTLGLKGLSSLFLPSANLIVSSNFEDLSSGNIDEVFSKRFLRLSFSSDWKLDSNSFEDLLREAIAYSNILSLPKGLLPKEESFIDYTQYRSYVYPESLDYIFSDYNSQELKIINIGDFDGDSREFLSIDLDGKMNFKKIV